MEVCIDIFGKPEIFLISVALLIAILSVWAQQWVSTYKIYRDNYSNYTACERRRTEYSTSFWLGWVYLAILIALKAFALAAWTYFIRQELRVPVVAIGLFGVSLYMTGIQVLQSCVSAFSKFFKGKDFDKPIKFLSRCCLIILLVVLVGIGVFVYCIFVGIIPLNCILK